MKKYKKGDTLLVRHKGNIVEGIIDSIDKPIIVDKQKRVWALVLVPDVLKIENCTHNIRQRRWVDLAVYKPPKKGAKKHGKTIQHEATQVEIGSLDLSPAIADSSVPDEAAAEESLA